MTEEAPKTAIRCPRCPSWWTGLIAGHCPTCHRTFTNIRAFDKHRAGSHARNTRYCRDPATLRDKYGDPVLVPANKKWVGWALPGSWDGPTDDDE